MLKRIGVTVGEGAVIGAGAVAPGPLVVPARTLWLGVPARQVGEASDSLQALSAAARDHYREIRARYLTGLTPADAIAEAFLRGLG